MIAFLSFKKSVGQISNRNKIKYIPHVGLRLFPDAWPLALKVFMYLRKSNGTSKTWVVALN